ncbi:MAG: acylphosphatase [Epsilonproteobacteria bacterium]|nr:acylphosphatase [Campylobacterota bacterium]
MKSYKFLISGKVQHVYYRKYTSEALRDRGYVGYVKNLDDGRVEAVVRIENDDQLKEVLEILKKGSPASRVDNIEIIELDSDDIVNNSFEIRY